MECMFVLTSDQTDRGERIRFASSILPKWARRTKSLDALLPVLYLRAISAGDFQEVLTALLGKDAPNLSPAVIARLKALSDLRRNIHCDRLHRLLEDRSFFGMMRIIVKYIGPQRCRCLW